ncbi:group 1 glycosyl transferase [Hyphomicrobium denitrificans 1NES1]|uniref:Group 1 glycosyl transferase n=1 Tax=Hyphomicrobium denitrificans 1NES1 TaxID=670307 RepID=N0AZP3_9HYPH|nr:group 1 glycosyl transferase [Hyphomicrobium denitrificans 1NES1]
MHVITGLGTGGTEMMCLRLARHWQNRFEQHALAWSSSSRSLERDFNNVFQDHVSVLPSDRQSYFDQWRWARKQIAQRKPDAILLHCFGIPHLIVAAAARSAGVRRVSAWAGNPPPRSRIARLRFCAILAASRIIRCPVLSCSRTVEQEFKQLGIGMPARSAVLPNAVDVADILADARRLREMRSDLRPTIAMVSRLDVIKDHATLLEAFAIVRRDMPSAQLWIVGDGALRGNLEAQARSLGIAESTSFLGNQTDVARLLGQVDVFAFSTTRDEGFGIVLIEAMAAGIPVVASDVAACREVLADGEAGILVSPSDPVALASAISRVLNSPELRTHFASKALQRIRSEYGIESCAQRWEAQLFGAPQSLKRFAECAS